MGYALYRITMEGVSEGLYVELQYGGYQEESVWQFGGSPPELREYVDEVWDTVVWMSEKNRNDDKDEIFPSDVSEAEQISYLESGDILCDLFNDKDQKRLQRELFYPSSAGMTLRLLVDLYGENGTVYEFEDWNPPMPEGYHGSIQQMWANVIGDGENGHTYLFRLD